VEYTPSWALHREVGKIICAIDDLSDDVLRSIDSLIDSAPTHDAGRYDADTFELQIREVIRYGHSGICYYLLHHMLDILIDKLVSVIVDIYKDYGETLHGYCPQEEISHYLVMHMRKAVDSIKVSDKVIFYALLNDRVALSDSALTNIVKEYINCLISLLKASVEYVIVLLLRDKSFLRKLKTAIAPIRVWHPEYATLSPSLVLECVFKAVKLLNLKVVEERLSSLNVTSCRKALKDINESLKHKS